MIHAPGRMYLQLAHVVGCCALLAAAVGCKEVCVCDDDPEGLQRPDGWTVASHCPGEDADYDRIFDDAVVHRIDIVIKAAHHNNAMDDLQDKLARLKPGDAVPDPIWVEVDLSHDGLTWHKVGMRYKGNTSLISAWQQGVRKLSFRMQIDKFEDLYPELKNQRFFGFRKLIFASGYQDPSLIREQLALSIFGDGGVPAARGAFARVYVDSGLGSQYQGLFTMMEDPSNKMLDSQFYDDGGNLYKPDGEGAKLKTFIQQHMVKKTNENAADYGDVKTLISALNADRTDAAAWRKDLEKTFNIPVFLKYLAISQAMQNWDAYGFMSHNYYLYADPGSEDRLIWIPWDLTVAMTPKVVDSVDTGSVLLAEVTADWPLIRHVLDDPQYFQTYRKELKAALDGPLAISKVTAKMDAYHALIEPYVTGKDGETAPYTTLASPRVFEQSLTTGAGALKPHLSARHAAVKKALGLQP